MLEERFSGGFFGALWGKTTYGSSVRGWAHFSSEEEFDKAVTWDSHLVEYARKREADKSARFLFLDIDGKSDTLDEARVLKTVKKVLAATLDSLSLELDPRKVYVLSACRPGKVSFHVKCAQFVFKTKADEKNFYGLLQTKARELDKEKVLFDESDVFIADPAVVRTRQMMRCLGQSKPGKSNSRLRLVSGPTKPSAHLHGSYFPLKPWQQFVPGLLLK